jgi:hypothetical protein
VITFWDEWKTCDDFKGISNEEDAREAARERIRLFMPSLGDGAVDPLFVSARNCMQSAEVPESERLYYTEEWNVDNVRQTISSYVRSNTSVLASRKRKESALDLQRRHSVTAQARGLYEKTRNHVKKIQATLRRATPSGAHEKIRDKLQQLFLENSETNYETISRNLEQKFRQKVMALTSPESIAAAIVGIQQEIGADYLEQITKARRYVVFELEKFKQIQIDSLLDSYGLDKKERKSLNEEWAQHVSQFQNSKSGSGTPPKLLDIPAGVILPPIANYLGAILGSFPQWAVRNIPLAAIIVLLPIGVSMVRAIPVLGAGLASKVPLDSIVLASWVMAVFSIILISIRNIQASRREASSANKDTLLYKNSHEQIAKCIAADAGKTGEELVSKLATVVEGRLMPLDADTRSAFDALTRELEKFEDKATEIRNIVG